MKHFDFLKRISLFSLFGLIAVSASAQAETYAVATGFTPTDNQVVQATASVALTFGADGAWAAGKAATNLTGYTAYVSGTSNPSYSTTINGTATKISYTDSTKSLPNIGTYYIFAPSKSGTISAGIVLNASKSFYVIKGSDASNLDSGVLITDNSGTSYTLGLNGTASYSLASKLYGFCTFDVVAGETYYILCTGSKLGFFGFSFTEASTPTNMSAITTETNVNAPIYNLSGQRVAKAVKGVYIQNGKKFIAK